MFGPGLADVNDYNDIVFSGFQGGPPLFCRANEAGARLITRLFAVPVPVCCFWCLFPVPRFALAAVSIFFPVPRFATAQVVSLVAQAY